jgi:hypothetical protein
LGEENWDSVTGVPLMEHFRTRAGGKMLPLIQHSCDRLLASHLLSSPSFFFLFPRRREKKRAFADDFSSSSSASIGEKALEDD